MDKPAVHYAMSIEEHRWAIGGRYVDPDRYRLGHRDYRPEMICRSGSAHAYGTRDLAKLTCPACRERMGLANG